MGIETLSQVATGIVQKRGFWCFVANSYKNDWGSGDAQQAVKILHHAAKDSNAATRWIWVKCSMLFKKYHCCGDERVNQCLIPHLWNCRCRLSSTVQALSLTLSRSFITLWCFLKEFMTFSNFILFLKHLFKRHSANRFILKVLVRLYYQCWKWTALYFFQSYLHNIVG